MQLHGQYLRLGLVAESFNRYKGFGCRLYEFTEFDVQFDVLACNKLTVGPFDFFAKCFFNTPRGSPWVELLDQNF